MDDLRADIEPFCHLDNYADLLIRWLQARRNYPNMDVGPEPPMPGSPAICGPVRERVIREFNRTMPPDPHEELLKELNEHKAELLLRHSEILVEIAICKRKLRAIDILLEEGSSDKDR
jgi:hypothetical protein